MFDIPPMDKQQDRKNHNIHDVMQIAGSRQHLYRALDQGSWDLGKPKLLEAP